MRIVIALGGNAMTSPDGKAGPEDQWSAIQSAAGPIADLVAAGHQVMLTHGNGPQVGNLLVKNEAAAAVVPPVPLDWCGAQTQATIGMLLMNALDAAFADRGVDQRTAVLVSRTLVDADDPGFGSPTKPSGRALAADAMLAAGFVVVSSGGGGIPTVRRPDGTLAGVEAVIDKDLTAALIAEHLGADLLVIATDVDNVVLDYGTPQARPVQEVDVRRMRDIAAEQHFAAGSMGPKVESVTRFVERCRGTGIITSLGQLSEAAAGRSGTRVVPA